VLATELQLGDATADPAPVCCRRFRLRSVGNGLVPGYPDAFVVMHARAAGLVTPRARWREAAGGPQPGRALGD